MPTIQGYDPNAGFGPQLGQAIGGGLSAGLTQMLEQKQNRRALEGLSPFLDQLDIPKQRQEQIFASGANPEMIAKLIPHLQNSIADKQALEAYNRSIYGAPEATGSAAVQEAAPATGNQPESSTAVLPTEPTSQYKTKPIIASRQIPPPQNREQIMQHTNAVQTAKGRADKLTEEGRKSRRGKAEQATTNKPLLAKAAQLAEKGNVSGLAGHLQASLGEKFPSIKGADVKELQRITKEVTVGRFREDFGARPSASEFFYIQDVYMRPGDPKESIQRSIKLQQQIDKLGEKRFEIENNILSQYGEYPINIDAMIEERMTPYYKNMLKNIGYDNWEGKHKSEVNKINEGEKRLKVYDSQGKHVGSISSDEIGQLPQGYQAK